MSSVYVCIVNVYVERERERERERLQGYWAAVKKQALRRCPNGGYAKERAGQALNLLCHRWYEVDRADFELGQINYTFAPLYFYLSINSPRTYSCFIQAPIQVMCQITRQINLNIWVLRHKSIYSSSSLCSWSELALTMGTSTHKNDTENIHGFKAPFDIIF